MSTDLSPNGAETQLCRLARSLKARGLDVGVISMRPPAGLVTELQAAGIEVETLNMSPGSLNATAPGRLFSILRRWRPSVLTTFNYHANIAGRLVGPAAGVPVVVTSIRTPQFGSRLREIALRLTDGMSSITCTNSKLVGDALVTRGVLQRERLRFIPNAVDVSSFSVNPHTRAGVRGHLGVPPDRFLWLAVGRLETPKNYPMLLRSIARLKAQDPRFTLHIAGRGPLQSMLEKNARDYGVEKQVRFLGYRRDVAELLAAADGLVLSSSWEGLPNVVMEALASGTPVVATEVGGVRELVTDGESGYIVPVEDEAGLASAMAKLMAAPRPERARMGQKGRRHIEQTYGVERVTAAWLTLYRELLAEKGLWSDVPADRKTA
jgi:glycosyltransferase involved in cell wall biosynthesis